MSVTTARVRDGGGCTDHSWRGGDDRAIVAYVMVILPVISVPDITGIFTYMSFGCDKSVAS